MQKEQDVAACVQSTEVLLACPPWLGLPDSRTRLFSKLAGAVGAAGINDQHLGSACGERLLDRSRDARFFVDRRDEDRNAQRYVTSGFTALRMPAAESDKKQKTPLGRP